MKTINNYIKEALINKHAKNNVLISASHPKYRIAEAYRTDSCTKYVKSEDIELNEKISKETFDNPDEKGFFAVVAEYWDDNKEYHYEIAWYDEDYEYIDSYLASEYPNLFNKHDEEFFKKELDKIK